MKKLLVILSLILVLVLTFTACNKNKNDDGDTDGGSGGGASVVDGGDSASKDAIANLFKDSGTLGELFESFQGSASGEINIDAIYEEILKLSGEGAFDFTGEANSETISAEGYIGFDDGKIAINVAAGDAGDSVNESAYAFFTEDLKLVMVASSEGTYTADVEDFGMYLEQVLGSAGTSGDASAAMDSMLDMVKDFKLPELKSSDLTYKEGKYIINKSYWNSVVNYTVDAIVDAAKNEGATDADIDAEAKEMKDMINGVVNAITFDIYFKAQGETVVGLGLNVGVNKTSLQKIGELTGGGDIDEGLSEISLSFEIGVKGDNPEYVDIKAKVVGDDASKQKVDLALRLESVFDGEDKICGLSATASVDVIMTSGVANDGENASYEHTENVKMNAAFAFDLSKVNVANAEVLSLEFGLSQTESGKTNALEVNVAVKALGDNAYDFSMTYDDLTKVGTEITAGGTISYSEIAANFPTIPDEVLQMKDTALENYANGLQPGVDNGVESGSQTANPYAPGYTG